MGSPKPPNASVIRSGPAAGRLIIANVGWRTACGRLPQPEEIFAGRDWRLQRPFTAGRAQVIPSVEMFNTFNNANNVNPLTTAALFNFDGFLRQGVGDPRQVQLAVRVTF